MDCLETFEVDSKYNQKHLLAELGYKIDDKIIHCPKCKSTRVRKIILMPSVIYRGDGFTKAVTGNDHESTDSD